MLLIAHLTALLSLALASIVDLKKREVPDTISYATMIVAAAIGVFAATATNDWEPLITMLAGAGLASAIGLVMFFAGQWGGGDAKLIVGLGALMGATSQFYTFLIMTILAGAAYGILYGAYLAIKRRKGFKKAFRKTITSPAIKTVRVLFQLAIILSLITALFLLEETIARLSVVLIAAGAYVVFYAWLFARALEEGCMKVKTPVKDLVEGDWVLEDIKIGDETITPAKYGITKSQLEKIQRSKHKKVLVKEGIPFVPSFLLAYLATITLSYTGIILF